MGAKRSIIRIDESLCNGCGQCVGACAEGAIQLIDGKAKLVSDVYCDGLGACIGECPTGALTIEQREAEAFDEAAVHKHLAAQNAKVAAPPAPPVRAAAPAGGHAGCPSQRLNTQSAALPEYGNWPVQIRLISPAAPYLQDAHLLVAADCVPVRLGGFIQDYTAGKVVMIGCPKFDDAELYVDRFADIFAHNNIQSVTCLVMEVPCCQGLPMMVAEGMRTAQRAVPLEKVVVGVDGRLVSRQQLSA